MLISFAVNAKLICVFVFTCAKIWFSPDAAHMGETDWVLPTGFSLQFGAYSRDLLDEKSKSLLFSGAGSIIEP